ncbi:hypothetical protein [Thiorhodococcus minor]|uniref:DUF4175 domain-containing protein n=1 Tax=Thiorhodococcus minor TaxID=57489 RepID=A0A6M0JVN4_9GAMM|nr:hypothetical protein [Thiorhodococcus minor]NEV61596.1 hypothetical protein [Thiorhodococcus minor]
MLTRLMLDLPLWVFALFACLFGALVYPWMIWLVVVAAAGTALGLLGFLVHVLRGGLPLQTPIERATRGRRRSGR